MRGLTRCGLIGLAAWVIFPGAVHAQGSITGVVKDASGAVLPAVTVEAMSPALIEKVRTAVTDGTGQYRIIDLRPGIYTVTFALQGFSPLKREGIELTGSFTATVNGDMRVGTVAETITVTGESPMVDVQSTVRERVMGKDVLDAIPAGRSHLSLAVLIPGMTRGAQDVGGTNTLALSSVTIHGGRSEDQRLLIDGLTIRNVAGNGQTTNFIPDMGSSQEVTIDYAAASAEAITGGVQINYVPREGGNSFKASFFGTAANSSFQGSNYSQELQARGLRAPNSLKFAKDIIPGAGGPIVKDRLWFYSTTRWQTQQTYVAGLWNNLNAGDPTKWNYAPDLSHQAVFALKQYSASTRLTWQVTPRNKLNMYYEHQTRDYDNVGLPSAPESNQHWVFPRNRTATITWSSPLTNRLLLEARVGTRAEDIRNIYPTDPLDPFRTLITVVEQGGLIPGLRYRGKGVSNDTSTSTFDSIVTPSMLETKAALSYVTGRHAFYFNSGFREFHLGPVPLIPARNIAFPDTSWYEFKDVSPRFGAAYDVFGNTQAG